MKCHDVRKYLYAFLDGELDVEKNIEVLAHLDMCYECSMKIEKERLIQKRVKNSIFMIHAPAHLRNKILKNSGRKPSFQTLLKKNLFPKKRLIPIIGVTAAITLVVLFFVVQHILLRKDMLYLAESKYHQYLKEQLKPDIRSQSNVAIMEYIRKKIGLPVVLPDMKENVSLLGAAFSEMQGIKIPIVFYMHNDVPVALFILQDALLLPVNLKKIDFTKMKETVIDNMVVYTDTGVCGYCQILGWEEADGQYLMISTLNRYEMIKIFRKV